MQQLPHNVHARRQRRCRFRWWQRCGQTARGAGRRLVFIISSLSSSAARVSGMWSEGSNTASVRTHAQPVRGADVPVVGDHLGVGRELDAERVAVAHAVPVDRAIGIVAVVVSAARDEAALGEEPAKVVALAVEHDVQVAQHPSVGRVSERASRHGKRGSGSRRSAYRKYKGCAANSGVSRVLSGICNAYRHSGSIRNARPMAKMVGRMVDGILPLHSCMQTHGGVEVRWIARH